MKCPKCEAELASGAIMCPKCGSPVREQEKAPEAAKPKLKFAYIAAAVLALIIILGLVALFAFKGQPIAQTGKTVANSGPAITNTPPPTPGGPAITNTPPTTAPQPPVSSSPAKAAVPPEVTDYLAFVKQIESKRQTIVATGNAESGKWMNETVVHAIDSLTSGTEPEKNIIAPLRTSVARDVDRWTGILHAFDEHPAPQNCTAFAKAYRALLAAEISTSMDVQRNIDAFDPASFRDPQELPKSLKKLVPDLSPGGLVDKSFDAATAAKAELCTQYGIEDPFVIKKDDSGGGSITGVDH